MGGSTPLIRSVATPGYARVSIEASDGNRYEADLSSLSAVYCFPRTPADWSRISIDPHGLGLVWASRFEVHVDQVIGLATRIEPISTQPPSFIPRP